MKEKNTYKTAQSEEFLIKKAQKDPLSFEPLYNLYYERIYSFIRHRIIDVDESADITSRVFLKALENIKKYTYQGLPLSSWLFRIAINECNSHFRKQKKQRHVILDEQLIDSLSQEIEDEKEELKLKLKKCIQKLSGSEVELLQLRFFESRPFKELGDILNISENNAKVKTYRLIGKLRKLILS